MDFLFTVEVVERPDAPDDEVTEVRWFRLDELPPEEQFAFDHYENVQLFQAHREQPRPPPTLGPR